MNDLAVMDFNEITSPEDLKANVGAIKKAMMSVMQPDMHYGLIPGCGDKPALFQPGAHKLGLLFNLAPAYEIEINNFPGGHREYEVTCRLTHRASERFIGEGVGVCTTMESKYRFRSEDTGVAVPPEYWDTRDKELLGGPSFSVKKLKKKWRIVQRVEHDNPADYYNTVKKISKKRAYNDAILTATGASDIFQPDDDTDPELYNGGEGNDQEGPDAPQQPKSRKEGSSGGDGPIQDGAKKILLGKMERASKNESDLCHHFKIGHIDELPQAKINEALQWATE